MIEKVKLAIEKYNMINSGEAVTVALSGGADSVALLHVLLKLGIETSACHINHNLRGEESDRDEQLVRDLCREADVKLKVFSIDVRSMQKKHESIEEIARKARYRVFEEFHCVATGHTASDNSETVLINLIRGTGLKGLCGIPPVRCNNCCNNQVKIIRPLILCERSDIEEHCRNHGLQYATDSTNSSDEFTRNKIRMGIVPIIKEINPSFDSSVTRMCEALREDSDFLEKSSESPHYRAEYLRSLEKPLLTRIIMRLLSNNNISPSNLKISQIIEIIESEKGKINVAKHKFALIEDGILKIETIPQNYRK
jgi:tRNA(Ile)-lysidine synthase